ncbi:hypothetical protein ABZ868_02800, partial [Rothia kristinae]
VLPVQLLEVLALQDLVAELGVGDALLGGQPLGGEIDLRAAGEIAPTVAAIAALCPGTTRLSGIAHLRGHETDRLAALAAELTRLGAGTEETADGLVITGPAHRAARMRTYEDHRMATAAAVLGLIVPGVLVENVATTGKTLPDFPGLWRRMLGEERA